MRPGDTLVSSSIQTQLLMCLDETTSMLGCSLCKPPGRRKTAQLARTEPSLCQRFFRETCLQTCCTLDPIRKSVKYQLKKKKKKLCCKSKCILRLGFFFIYSRLILIWMSWPKITLYNITSSHTSSALCNLSIWSDLGHFEAKDTLNSQSSPPGRQWSVFSAAWQLIEWTNVTGMSALDPQGCFVWWISRRRIPESSSTAAAKSIPLTYATSVL